MSDTSAGITDNRVKKHQGQPASNGMLFKQSVPIKRQRNAGYQQRSEGASLLILNPRNERQL
jgi:hypothetical protein